jgi:hypothetical protein
MKFSWIGVAIVVLLAGCQGHQEAAAAESVRLSTTGVDTLGADEIGRRSMAALRAAGSYHVYGTFYDEDSTRVAIDVKVSGKDADNTITVGPVRMEVLLVGGATLVRGNEAFWAQIVTADRAHAVTRAAGKRWVRSLTSGTAAAGDYDASRLEALVKPGGPLTKGPRRTNDGVPTVGLFDKKAGTTLYVAATGEPYPITFVGQNEDTLHFYEYGKAFPEIVAPPAGQTVQMAELIGR